MSKNVQISEELFKAIFKQVFFDVPMSQQELDQLEDKNRRMVKRLEYSSRFQDGQAKQ